MVGWDPGRIAKQGGLLLAQGGANHHRSLEKALQHEETPQCIGLPPTSPRGHRPDGPKADHALTIKMDQSDQATQRRN